MNYLIYKTTNVLDGKYYVGCHRTENVDDGYMGSGKHLKRAIQKYGAENFKVEILHRATSEKEMFEIERSLVSESLVNDPQSYNLKVGGSGGNPGIVGAFAGRKHTDDAKKKIRDKRLAHAPYSKETRQKMSDNCAMKRPEFKEKVSKMLSGRTCTDKHKENVALSNIGKVAVNNGVTAKKVTKEDAVALVQQGWSYGLLKRKSVDSSIGRIAVSKTVG